MTQMDSLSSDEMSVYFSQLEEQMSVFMLLFQKLIQE